MDQHLFVRWAQRNYDELGLRPVLEPTVSGVVRDWQEAHYPWSQKLCDTKIPLAPLDHAIQGLWQSEEQGEVCFYKHVTRDALYAAPDYWPAGWFEACDLYDKWAKARPYKCLTTGASAVLLPEEGLARGWVAANTGLTFEQTQVTCPHCGFVGEGGSGTRNYHFENCDQREGSWRWFQRELREWSNEQEVLARRGKTSKHVQCPHCKREGPLRQLRTWHFDNCKEREGSWRWFVEELKVVDPSWRKTDAGNWTNGQTPEQFNESQRGKSAPKKLCQHCTKEVDARNMSRFHGDKCSHREGSWRWFVEQLREADPTWKKYGCGSWGRA